MNAPTGVTRGSHLIFWTASHSALASGELFSTRSLAQSAFSTIVLNFRQLNGCPPPAILGWRKSNGPRLVRRTTNAVTHISGNTRTRRNIAITTSNARPSFGERIAIGGAAASTGIETRSTSGRRFGGFGETSAMRILGAADT